MKKTSYILTLLAAASVLFLSSCAKEKTVGLAEGELVEYTLQAEVAGTGAGLDIDTKVALNADGITPNWESGDQILVLDADKKPLGTDGIFTLSSGAGTASGKFTGTAYVGQKPTYAIYPASAATVSGADPVTAGTFSCTTGDKTDVFKQAIMLGTSSDGKSVSFTNACAVLTFNTGDYGKSGGDPAIKSVKVSASYGDAAAPIAGVFDIDWTTATPTIAPASSGTVNKLTVTLPANLQANSKDIYIPILPLAMQSSTAPSMKYVFKNVSGELAEVSHDFTAAIAANTLKNLGTAGGMEFLPPPPYVEIEAKYDGTNVTTLKWYRQNLAISDSGKMSWKGDNKSAVKVPGTDENVIVGDYFQWAAYAGYCGNATAADKGLLIYKSFDCTKCVEGISDSFSFKDDGSGKTYWFSGSDNKDINLGKSPYYNGSAYSKYSKSEKLGLSDDVANIILGGYWRMPTLAEFTALAEVTYWAWDTNDKGSYVFIPGQGTQGGAGSYGTITNTDDKEQALLFFPGAGFGGRDREPYTNIQMVGTGYYNTSICSSASDKGMLHIRVTSSKLRLDLYSYRYEGCSVRPVSDK